MDSFWKLSDSKEKIRNEASFKILNNLHRQKRQNEDNFSENLAYDLKRIVSGLSSERINARKGYFVSLVEMLQMFPDEANIPKVYELMEKHLSMKGSKSVSILCSSINQSSILLMLYLELGPKNPFHAHRISDRSECT